MNIRTNLDMLNDNRIVNLPEPLANSEPARKDHTHTAVNVGAIASTEKGANSGVATLDTAGYIIPEDIPIIKEVIDITESMITNKALNLSNECETSKPVTAVIITANNTTSLPLNYGIDFTITGSSVSWTGLGLDGALIIGDDLEIVYFRKAVI